MVFLKICCLPIVMLVKRMFFPAQRHPFASLLIRKRMVSNSPTKSLLVVGVDLAGLLQLGDELGDALGIVFGVEVDDEGVDHFCG